jgi:hypothetical protein
MNPREKAVIFANAALSMAAAKRGQDHLAEAESYLQDAAKEISEWSLTQEELDLSTPWLISEYNMALTLVEASQPQSERIQEGDGIFNFLRNLWPF